MCREQIYVIVGYFFCLILFFLMLWLTYEGSKGYSDQSLDFKTSPGKQRPIMEWIDQNVF